MSRGAQQTTRNLADQQLAQQNQMISQEGQSDTQDRLAADAHDSEPAQ